MTITRSSGSAPRGDVVARTINVKGLDALMAAFVAAGRDAPRLAMRALKEEADEAFYLSQQVVPVRYGVLKSSGKVHDPVMRGTEAVVDITYGGAAAPYAVYVHELPPSRARHDPPTRWKYLERPVKVYSEGMADRMATRVMDMLNERFNI